MDRRTFLAAVGSAAITAVLAGCTSESSSPGEAGPASDSTPGGRGGSEKLLLPEAIGERWERPHPRDVKEYDNGEASGVYHKENEAYGERLDIDLRVCGERASCDGESTLRESQERDEDVTVRDTHVGEYGFVWYESSAWRVSARVRAHGHVIRVTHRLVGMSEVMENYDWEEARELIGSTEERVGIAEDVAELQAEKLVEFS